MLRPLHPENAAAATVSSGRNFEIVSPSGFSGDVDFVCLYLSRSHVRCTSPVPRSAGPSLSSGPNLQSVQRPCTHDAVLSLTSSVEHTMDVNGGATAHSGVRTNFLSPLRPVPDSALPSENNRRHAPIPATRNESHNTTCLIVFWWGGRWRCRGGLRTHCTTRNGCRG
jgi:hypothetical protein